MKKVIIKIIGVCVLTALTCCSKKSDPTPQEDPVPNWSITQTNPDYTSSMTLIMAMPESFTVTPTDCMAVFSGDECVGLAKNPVETPNGYRFFLYIIKPLDPSLFLDLKMYSFNLKRMFTIERYCKYWIDDAYGTIEEPLIFEPK